MKSILPTTSKLKNTFGFTLIELLIVIVIIGILSGVVISVINPKKQQERAKDASTRATMEKIYLVAESYVSSYGKAPNTDKFIESLKSVSSHDSCDTPDPVGGDYECLFTMESNTLPATCGADEYSGSGSTQCEFYYLHSADSDETHFAVYAKAYSYADSVFLFDNTIGAIQVCSSDLTGCTTTQE